MNIFNRITKSNNVHPNYLATYGWQEAFGDGMIEFGYISSYKDTADILVDKEQPDLLLFPIMFNYRQYIELVLKNICYTAMEADEYKKFINATSHDVRKLWSRCSELLKDQLDSEQLKYITEIIEFFHTMDSSSFNFRYSMNKKLDRTLEYSNLSINTFELKSIIDKMDDYLYFSYGS